MIEIVKIDGNIIEVRPEGKLRSGDFMSIAPKVDEIIQHHGKIRLIIDGRAFHGWENVSAAEEHFNFIRDHHRKVEKVAAVAPYDWIIWLASITNVFVEAEIKTFSLDELGSAREWITQ